MPPDARGGGKPITVRLSDQMAADLDALTPSAGTATAAIREALHLTRVAVEAAARENADELSEDDWTRLAHLNQPDDPELGDLGLTSPVDDWSQRLAAELVGAWEGRPTPLPGHKAEKRAAKDLAERVAAWGPVRGYALMTALRYFWKSPEAGIGACASPEVWMVPTAE